MVPACGAVEWSHCHPPGGEEIADAIEVEALSFCGTLDFKPYPRIAPEKLKSLRYVLAGAEKTLMALPISEETWLTV